jgi:hypothetical protein
MTPFADGATGPQAVARAPGEQDLLQAFRVIDDALGASACRGGLLAFRERLAGELLGEAERVATALGPGFELVTHAHGATTVTSRDAVIASIRALGETGAVIWAELDDLAADRGVVAGHGLLRTLTVAADGGSEGPGRSRLTTVPFAFFIRFDGELMSSEVLYMDAAASQTIMLRDATMPSRERLRHLVDRGKGRPWS